MTVTNTAGVAASMVAQYALGAMLSFSLRFPAFDEARRRREWIAGQVAPLDGKTVLIVGLGRTGQALATFCKALGMTVIGTRARPQPTLDADEVHGIEALPALLLRADFVVLCVPLLPTTRGLIDARALAAMRPSAVLIDVSRGGVVDEAALVEALRSGGIAGAALEVFAIEPLPPESPLWDAPNPDTHAALLQHLCRLGAPCCGNVLRQSRPLAARGGRSKMWSIRSAAID